MDKKRIIDDFNNLIVETIKKHELKVNADTITLDPFFIGEKARDARLEYNITTDIGFIHDDLIYTTGILYALKPYINNPLTETVFVKGKEYSTYHQNLYDSLYSMYASVCFEKLYNLWDRIGDKIANEFPEIFKNPRSIMFANVIERLREELSSDENIRWLSEFKDTNFPDFNEKRKLVVHYEHIETKYKESILNQFGDMDAVEAIWIEKSTLPGFFKKHIEFANEGIKRTYDFIKNRLEPSL